MTAKGFVVQASVRVLLDRQNGQRSVDVHFNERSGRGTTPPLLDIRMSTKTTREECLSALRSLRDILDEVLPIEDGGGQRPRRRIQFTEEK